MKVKNTRIIISITVLSFIIVFRTIACSGELETEKKGEIIPPVGDTTRVSDKYTEVVSLAGNPYTYSIPVEDLPVPAAETLKAILLSSPGIEKVISKKTVKNEPVWRIDSYSQEDNHYDLEIDAEGTVLRYNTSINRMKESMGNIFHEDKIREIPKGQLPEPVTGRMIALFSEHDITKAYSVDAINGLRFFVQYGKDSEGTTFSLTGEGEIRSAGPTSRMLKPYTPTRIETEEEIDANLSRFGKKYHVDKVIKQIQEVKYDLSEGFRFVVVGDSRNNLEIWEIITQSINKWNPLFVITTGDMTPRGYSKTMAEYHLATLEKYARYPHLPSMGNHDCRAGNRTYEYVFGGKGSRVYHFDYGSCRFIILDNYECDEVMLWKDQLKLADEWLAEKKDYRKFVFIHLPPPEVKKWAYHAMYPEMSDPFVKLMSKHHVDHVFAGHIHAYSTAVYDGVEYTVTGGGGAPLHTNYGDKGSHYHYVVVEVVQGRVDMKLVRFLPQDEAASVPSE